MSIIRLPAYLSICLFLIVSSLTGLYSQETITITGEPLAVVEYDLENTTYHAYANTEIGRKDGSVWPDDPASTNDIYRTRFKFNVSQIPDDATIDEVEFKFSFLTPDPEDDCLDCTAKIVSLPLTVGDDPENVFDKVGEGSTYEDDISYLASNFAKTIADMADDLQNALSGDNFYVGAMSEDEDSDATRADFSGVSITVTFTAPYDVTVKNSFGEGDMKIDGTTMTIPAAGESFEWIHNTNHTLEALDQVVDGEEWVFNEWLYDGQSSSSRTLNITVSKDITYTASFDRILNVTLQTDFIGSGTDGELILDGNTVTTPHSVQVVSNTSIQLEAPDQDRTVNGETVPYHLLKWSTGSRSKVYNFTPTEHTTLTADYKAKLRTFSQKGLDRNNQRKMVFDNGTYHMVYEDNGDIYYVSSTNDGNTWSRELLLSSGSGGQRHPSIISTNSGLLAVVWEHKPSSGASIKLRVRNGGSWGSILDVASYFTLTQFHATPVVSFIGGNHDLGIVWHDGDGNNLKIRPYDVNNGTFGTETDIPNTGSSSLYPAVAEDINGNMHLVWQESGKIYYSTVDYASSQFFFGPHKVDISTGSGFTHNKFPSITTDYNRRPSVVWEGRFTPTQASVGQRVIVFRQRDTSLNWQAAVSFQGSDHYHRPSIMGFPNVLNNADLRIAWTRADDQIWISSYDGNSWTTTNQNLTGQAVGLSENVGTTANAKMVYRDTGVSPYKILTTSDNLEPIPSKRSAGNDDESLPANVPSEFALLQNYPNPFNPTTTISYKLPVPAQVKLIVYDLNGKEIKVLVNAYQNEGIQQVRWNGRDASEQVVASGIYFYKLIAGDYVQTRKLMFSK